MFKALFEHNKASHSPVSDSPVSVLKGMNGFKADMKIKNVVKGTMFLCVVLVSRAFILLYFTSFLQTDVSFRKVFAPILNQILPIGFPGDLP